MGKAERRRASINRAWFLPNTRNTRVSVPINTVKASTDKPNLTHRWQTEEQSLSGNERWTILVQAARLKGEEILGWGWVPMHDPDALTATVSFHHETATTLLRTLYSTFAALEDADDYLKQVGLGWTLAGGQSPSSGIVGSARDYGSAQVYVDWGSEQRHSLFMIYPPNSPHIHVMLGIDSVANLIQLTTQAFHSLDWPVPK